ncbi:hypothetical protein CYMTET_27061, partial [Cymbomonas tetramitiformis]
VRLGARTSPSPSTGPARCQDLPFAHYRSGFLPPLRKCIAGSPVNGLPICGNLSLVKGRSDQSSDKIL